MKSEKSHLQSRLEMLGLLILLPLLGMTLADKPLDVYFEFPPLTRSIRHAPFSWAVFAGLAILIAITVLPFLLAAFQKPKTRPSQNQKPENARDFPWWGWVSLAVGCLSWILAWTRFDAFQAFQIFTFTPLWLSTIGVVNALTWMRTGRCMLTHRPRYTALLFVISAGFWWYFEYLNRFVQNWHYEGIEGLSPLRYILFATPPFATVLPAVLGVFELMQTGTRHGMRLDEFPAIRLRHPEWVAWPVALLSGLGLFAVGLYPDLLFPLLWVAPLLIITSIQCVDKERTLFASLEEGHWRDLYLLAVSALVCGFLWELWNMHSLAKWTYAIPFVQRFHLFEMPLLGYAGYLPFGLECAVIAELFLKPRTFRKSLPPPHIPASRRIARRIKAANLLLLAGGAVYFFILPGFLVMNDLTPTALDGTHIHPRAWSLHRSLTDRYADWAEKRIASGTAGDLNLYDVPSTEWPMMGSLFYLMATESLQTSWEKIPKPKGPAPADYAERTIEAAINLIMDPVHHDWVKTHWGDDYLHRENVFFRSILIGGITSYEKLTGNTRWREVLLDQVNTLSAELDASPRGLLDDYPDECYPIDILPAIALIQEADAWLGTDHSVFIARSRRAFEGDLLDDRGLIPFRADAPTGIPLDWSRGVGNSHVLMFAHSLWPEQAQLWYRQYEQYFWQDRGWAAGFREYPNNLPGHEFDYDVDAGPILAGFGPSANAFGWAAAKINGRMDHAYTLGAQVLAACWPLPNGSLLGPKLLSNPTHAPYLGESCLLFFLTQTPAAGVDIVTGGHKPGVVYIGYAIYFGGGTLILLWLGWAWRRWRKRSAEQLMLYPTLQAIVWAGLLLTAFLLTTTGSIWTAALVLFFAVRFPRIRPGL